MTGMESGHDYPNQPISARREKSWIRTTLGVTMGVGAGKAQMEGFGGRLSLFGQWIFGMITCITGATGLST